MIPWFERPIVYDVRARPHLVESTSGSRDLQMVHFFSRLSLISNKKRRNRIVVHIHGFVFEVSTFNEKIFSIK